MGKIFDKKRVINRRTKSKKDVLSETENHSAPERGVEDMLKIEQKEEEGQCEEPEK